MKFTCPLIVVDDIEASKKFYTEILGQEITMDFGANVTFAESFAIQSKSSWMEFISRPASEIRYQGNDAELYFEEEEFDAFVERLKTYEVKYVHPVIEHAWGQRVVRFYDPDMHIVEVGESMMTVCRRFHAEGMTVEEIVARTMFPKEVVEMFLKEE
ncbi:MAG: VOC family protein [Candidatus Methanomethylophilaceae archaeon]|nr:VOC family protein [Candidatus Methanomethylophilaceae archaeon]